MYPINKNPIVTNRTAITGIMQQYHTSVAFLLSQDDMVTCNIPNAQQSGSGIHMPYVKRFQRRLEISHLHGCSICREDR